MSTRAVELSEHSASEQTVMVARQPIYNSQMGVFGYELLFRSCSGSSKVLRPTEATAQVLTSTILEFGLGKFVHNRKAAINVTRAFIEVITEIQLPSDQIILDISENIVVDRKLITKLEDLRSLGYGISIGGVSALRNPQLLPLSNIVQVDVQRVRKDQLNALVKYYRRQNNIALQALKIETMKEYRFYCDKGFEYLQGYFLGKPRVYVSRDISVSKLAVLQLLATVHDIDTPIEELEQQITSDVSLSYKLLKLVNAPFFGVARKVDSVKQVIVLLGRDEIRKWVSLLALGGKSDEPAAAMELAVLRAKICELLAEKAGLPKDSYFTAGMFSALDVLMNQPIHSILAKLPLTEAVKTAILKRQGMLGKAISCAMAIEDGQWSEVAFANLDSESFVDVYHQSIEWTDSMIRQF